MNKLMLDITESFDLDPVLINGGECTEWADSVFEALEEIGVEGEIWSTVWETALYYHVFIKVGDRFYDAEALQGVKDHKNLPFFQRVADNDNPVHRIV